MTLPPAKPRPIGPYAASSCAHCGEPIEQPAKGRPRRYCSNACKVAGNRYGDPCLNGRVPPERGGTARTWCRHPPPPQRRWYGY